MSVDRVAAIRNLHGTEVAEAAVRRVSEAIGATLRSSDVVARLDDDRIIAVLPNASAVHATRIAEFVRTAIEAACPASASLPRLTTSIGVACYPSHARDVHSLLASADAAMVRADRLGRNRVVSATPESAAATGLAQLAG